MCKDPQQQKSAIQLIKFCTQLLESGKIAVPDPTMSDYWPYIQALICLIPDGARCFDECVISLEIIERQQQKDARDKLLVAALAADLKKAQRSSHRSYREFWNLNPTDEEAMDLFRRISRLDDLGFKDLISAEEPELPQELIPKAQYTQYTQKDRYRD